MSSAARKKEEEPLLELLEQPTDREQGLARNFEDPALGELIPEGSLPSPPSEEDPRLHAVEGPAPEATSPAPPSAAAFEIPSLEPVSLPRWEMAGKLFELVLAECPFDQLVQRALDAVMCALGAQAGSVLELDHVHEDFFFRASMGGASSQEHLRAFRVPANKGIVGHVCESGQSLLLRSMEDDRLEMRAISASVGFEAVTCLAAPIVVGGQAYGVIELFNKRDGSRFDERDLRVLEECVSMVSKVLEVRFLMAELTRRAG